MLRKLLREPFGNGIVVADVSLRGCPVAGSSHPKIALGQTETMANLAVRETSALEESREFHLLADSIPHLAWIADPDGSIAWYNRRWYEYTGKSAEEMKGWGWQSVHDPDMLSAVLTRWRNSIASGEPFEMTFPLRGADGVFRPFLTRVVPSKNDRGELTRWFGTNTEVGDELRAVAALRESEERFRTATEAVSGVLWTNDANGEMRGEQPGWKKFTGQSEQEYQGYGWAATVHPDDAQPTIDRWLEAVAGRHLFAYEHRVRRHDGQYRLCSIRALPLIKGDGSVREWVGVHTDITTQRQTEEALRRNDKLAIAGRLATSTAHEINNPLDAILNNLCLLQDTALSPEQQELCQRMEEELHRVIEITDHSLHFQRQASGPGWVRADVLIESVLALFSARLRTLHIRVDCHFRTVREICGIDGELRQVIANLVGNAIDAMAGTGGDRVLSLSTRNGKGPAAQEGIVITVADTGPGMPISVAKQVFDPFFTTKGDKGTGLGLWVSSEIVRKHEGSMLIRSRESGLLRGTLFRVFLPVHPQMFDRVS